MARRKMTVYKARVSYVMEIETDEYEENIDSLIRSMLEEGFEDEGVTLENIEIIEPLNQAREITYRMFEDRRKNPK